MTREEAQQAWEKMRSEIDKENWLFVGTINPQMVDIAIEALESDTVEVVRCKDCKFNKKCTLQNYWTVDGFTEEIEYCSLGKRSEE